MKKFKLISTVLICIIVGLMCVACGFFGSEETKNDKKEEENYEITVNVNGTSYTYNPTIGEDLQIMKNIIPTKAGYYVIGYFDSESGGKKYFNDQGKSLTAWNADYPKTFYAQWASVQNYVICDERVLFEDVSESYGNEYYSIYSVGDRASAIAGNLDSTLIVRLSFKIKVQAPKHFQDGKIWIYLQDTNNNSAEVFARKAVPVTTDYQTQTVEFECPARAFGKSTVNNMAARRLYIKFNGSVYSHLFLKNFTYAVKFK